MVATISDKVSDQSDGKVQLVCETVEDDKIFWQDVDEPLHKEELVNDKLENISKGDIVEYDLATGNFELIH